MLVIASASRALAAAFADASRTGGASDVAGVDSDISDFDLFFLDALVSGSVVG